MNEFTGFKERLKESIDCRDLFHRYGVQTKKLNGQQMKCCCPWHEEKTPSCMIYPDHFYCYGCQVGGDAFDVVMKMDRVDFMEAMRTLAGIAGLTIPTVDPEAAAAAKVIRDRATMIRDCLKAANAYYRNCLESMPVGEAALKYCQKRGITKEIRQRFDVGFAPADRQIEKVLADYHPDVLLAAGITGRSAGDGFLYVRMKNRLTFGIRDERGRLCGFSGRIMEDESGEEPAKAAKYLNTPQTEVFDKSRLFFGWIQAVDAIVKTGSVVICEGQTDVLACHKIGVENAVAAMGTAFTSHHAKIIRRHCETVTLCMDGDAAGIKATMKAIEILTTPEEETTK